MHCERLAVWLGKQDETLERLPGDMEAHVRDCEQCRAMWADVGRALEVLRLDPQWGAVEPGDAFLEDSLGRIFGASRPRLARARAARRQRRPVVRLSTGQRRSSTRPGGRAASVYRLRYAVAGLTAAAAVLLAALLLVTGRSEPSGRYARGGRTPEPGTSPAEVAVEKSTSTTSTLTEQPTAPQESRKPAAEVSDASPSRTTETRAELTGGLERRGLAERRSREPSQGIAAAPAEELHRPGTSLAFLSAAEGAVEYARPGTGRWLRARTGTALATGDRVRTTLSRARIEFESGSVLFVNRWTTLTVDRKPRPPGLSMVGGEVYVETVPDDRGFRVETPHGRAVDLGTRFGLKTGPAGTKVVVAEGRAEASTDEGKAEIHAGKEVLLARRTSPPGPVREARDLERRLAWTDELGRRAVARDARLWLRFEGDVRDSSSFGNHGAAHGAASCVGRRGRGCRLDGAGQYVEVPHHTSLELSEGTMAAWIRLPALPKEDKMILIKDAQGRERGGHIRLFFGRDGVLQTRFQSADDDYALRAKRRLRPGVWHHVACTFGERGHRLYLDGLLEGSLAYAGGIERNTNPIRVGISYSGLHPLRGALDEVIVLARQLSDDEMRELFRRGGVPR